MARGYGPRESELVMKSNPVIAGIVAAGIAKVNVATSLVGAYRETLLSQWNAKQNMWVPLTQGAAVKEIARAVEE